MSLIEKALGKTEETTTITRMKVKFLVTFIQQVCLIVELMVSYWDE